MWRYTNHIDPAKIVMASAIRFWKLRLRSFVCSSSAGWMDVSGAAMDMGPSFARSGAVGAASVRRSRRFGIPGRSKGSTPAHEDRAAVRPSRKRGHPLETPPTLLTVQLQTSHHDPCLLQVLRGNGLHQERHTVSEASFGEWTWERG